SATRRAKLVDTMINYAVYEAAEQVVGVTSNTTDATPLWAITWRTRAAAWMLRNRTLLAAALS
ncbi:MAG TPA: hypothetical protein VGP93_04190, partial [Polyangiaceae bacterium]|nr:hypothetical protein [Polyangiaceae bacterium]